jgi:indolepyruvate ferredoxin oxidoreductase beta subunit
LRYGQENAAIEQWLARLHRLEEFAPEHQNPWAQQLLRMVQLRKGYSDTHARGLASYTQLWERFVQPAFDHPAQGQAMLSELTRALDLALLNPPPQALESPKTVFWAKPVKRAPSS